MTCMIEFRGFVESSEENAQQLLTEHGSILLGDKMPNTDLQMLFRVIPIENVEKLCFFINRSIDIERSIISAVIFLKNDMAIKIFSEWSVWCYPRLESFVLNALKPLSIIKEKVVFEDKAMLAWGDLTNEELIESFIKAAYSHSPNQFCDETKISVLNGEATKQILEIWQSME